MEKNIDTSYNDDAMIFQVFLLYVEHCHFEYNMVFFWQ